MGRAEFDMTTQHHDSSSSVRSKPIVLTGGVVRPYAMKHQGKPMRVAAWIALGGSRIGAAVVEGHGPSALHALFERVLERVPEAERPDEIVVWPAAAKPFRGLQFPRLTERRDEFLKIVVDDWIDAEMMHRGPLPVISV